MKKSVKSAREILDIFHSDAWHHIEGKSAIDPTLSSLSELVLAEKIDVFSSGDDVWAWNSAIDHIAKLIRGNDEV